LLAASIVASPLTSQQPADWANLQRYRQANSEVPPASADSRRVVFMGNSITEGWARFFPDMFPGKPYIGRGISGQTTPQMLVRFRQDVIALKPAVVLILAGTNDIAGNTGPSTLEMIEDNLMSMTEIAKANNIRVVLASVLPVFDYPWKKGLEPAPKIVALNAWIKNYASRVGAIYLDFHSAMADDRQGMRSEFTRDGARGRVFGRHGLGPSGSGIGCPCMLCTGQIASSSQLRILQTAASSCCDHLQVQAERDGSRLLKRYGTQRSARGLVAPSVQH